MFLIRKALLLALLLLYSNAEILFAQKKGGYPFASLNLYRLTGEEGLSQVSVNVLFKDSEGFLWIGTDDGLNRYDGKEMVKYYYRFDDPSTLAANEIYGICEDRSGRLWFAHYNGGISILDKRTNRFTRLGEERDKLSTNRIYGLICDRQGYIVARTVEGISKINPQTLQVRNFNNASFQDLNLGVHTDILEMPSHYWFGSRTKGLLQTDKQGLNVPLSAWDTARHGKAVFGLCQLNEKEVLAVSEKGLFRLQKIANDYVIDAIITHPNLFSSASKIIRYANTQFVWVATEDQGFFIVDLEQKKVIRQLKSELVKDNLLSNGVMTFLQDGERNVFIGTARGINVYSPYNNLFNNYENVFRKIPGFGHPVYAIHELENENLLLGTKKGGAYHYNVNTSELISLPVEGFTKQGKNVIIYHFSPFGKETFLVSTSNGVFELDTKVTPYQLIRSKRFKELELLADQKITKVYFQNDSIAWIASFTDGLFRWNYQQNQLKHFRKNKRNPSSGPVDDQVQNLVPIQEGKVIICTKYGFSILDPQKQTFENYAPGKNYPFELPGRNIKYAYDDGNSIWVTTFGAGVQKFDKRTKRFTSYTTKEGLPNDAVYSILPDDAGRLWIGTNNGLARLNPQSGNIKTYTTQDGLPDNEFNGHSAYRSASGKCFYSTLNGIVSVSPFLEVKNNYKPNLVLTNLTASNGKGDSSYITFGKQSYILPAGYDALDLKFAALSFASPKKSRYKVKLEGYDHGWKFLGNSNEMHYSNLPPGRYTLKVQAAINSDTWLPGELRIQIRIMPFWYQTLLFKIILIVIAAALLFYLVRDYYQDRLRNQRQDFEKKLAIQMERQRISSEIHDDIGSGLSAIRLLTEITKNKLPNTEMQQEVGRIHSSISELSGKMREVIWSLNGDNDNLESLLYYIQRQAGLLFENSRIDLKVSLPNPPIPVIIIKSEKRRHIYLSVKEALHNCLKHSGAQNCYLKMDIQESILHITILDDGKGFQPLSKGYLGNGLPGMKKRMQQVNGSFKVEALNKTAIYFTIPLKYG